MQANKIKTGRKTVILKINFGLGNQLFLYAAGYALSRRLDAQLWMLFNEDTTKNVFIAQERSYSLDFFDVKYDFIIDEKEFLKIKSYTRVTEENFFEIGDINSRYFLIDDCFESEIYFINYKDEILKLFEFKDINIFNKPKIREFTQRIDNSHSVAVHIRRGDFKKDPSRIIPTSYQILTMQRLKQYIKRPKYFIFSDDPCLIKDMFLNLKDVSLVSD